jgi:hypothetical protein
VPQQFIHVSGSNCSICGLTDPHSHTSDELEIARNILPAFQEFLKKRIVRIDVSSHEEALQTLWLFWKEAWTVSADKTRKAVLVEEDLRKATRSVREGGSIFD